MAKRTKAPVETPEAGAQPALRRCIGSARYGIEAHEALVEDFPRQPSQRDGLGRMCKTHWNQYTAGLARDAKARKAVETGTEPAPEVLPAETAPVETRAPRKGRRIASTTQGTRYAEPVAEGNVTTG